MAITVVRLEGKRLLCRAGRHEIVTDRKPDEGGTDSGCTSGELLLLAIGSCATGSLRNFLDQAGLPSAPLEVEVAFVASPRPGERDAIRILARLADGIPDGRIADVKAAALSGGVASRVRLGSAIEVEVARGR